MKSTTPIRISVESLPVVMGTNPEYADMDNPRGEVYSEQYYVYAELNGGEMYRHDMGTTSIEGSNDPYDCFTSVEYVKGFDTEEKAQAMADKITKAIANGRELDARYWVYERCSYGSEAYQKNGRGEREMLEWERQHEDY